MQRFHRKIALVTGGTRGIGLAIAQRLFSEGAKVIVTGREASASGYEADLSDFKYEPLSARDPQKRAALVERVGPIDILVNNAGGAHSDEYNIENFAATLEVNLVAAMDLSTRFYPVLAERRGVIVNIGSIASFLSLKEIPAYTASKAAVLGITRALADKWARHGVRVNMVAPGFIETDLTAGQRIDADHEKGLVEAIPMFRWGQPEEIAGAVLFLCSDDASYITGTSLIVDGGVMLR